MTASTIFLFTVLSATLALSLSSTEEWVRPGDPKLLICDRTYPSYKWFGPTGAEIIGDDRHILNNTAGTLNITLVGEDDVGEFTCENAEDKQQKSHVTIETSPYVPRMTKSLNHVIGESATLECTAWGSDTLEVSWFKSKDKEYTASPRSLLSNGTGSVTIQNVEGEGEGGQRKHHVKQRLILSNLTYDDYSYYTCYVENRRGNASSVTNVRVKDKLAPLWPFIGICVEILILIIIIVVYEKRKSKRTEEEDGKEKADLQSNANDHKGENVRFRK